MAKFEVGEVAIFVKPQSEFYGAEVKILSGLVYKRSLKNIDTGELVSGYRYQITNLYPGKCRRIFARPEYLRKKKPPESKDIQQTRKAKPISFNDVMEKVKQGELYEA